MDRWRNRLILGCLGCDICVGSVEREFTSGRSMAGSPLANDLLSQKFIRHFGRGDFLVKSAVLISKQRTLQPRGYGVLTCREIYLDSLSQFWTLPNAKQLILRAGFWEWSNLQEIKAGS